MRRRIAICGAGLLAASVLVAAIPALAHPKLVKALPANGVTLKKGPTKIQLSFDEELDITLSTFTVLNQKNEPVNTEDAKVNMDARKMIEGSAGPLTPGMYTVRWRAAGENDRIVVEGSFTFGVRE